MCDQAVPVAADVDPVGSGHVAGGDLEVGDGGVALGQQGLLQGLGDGALLAVEAVELAVEAGDGQGVAARPPAARTTS